MSVVINRAALTDFRKKDDLSIAALARKAGMDRSDLHNIESGKRPAGPVIRARLALALGVSVSSIEAQIIEAPHPEILAAARAMLALSCKDAA